MKFVQHAKSRRQTILVIVLLVATVWLARFWRSSEFGFYEDDFWRVTTSMHEPASVLGRHLIELFENYGRTQGRPLHDGLIRIFSYAGAQLGGLRGVYLLAFFCVALNAILYYLLLRRISANVTFVWMGALAFALYPADTTQTFLTHSFGVQPSLTFLLVAAHLYLSGKKIASYAFSAASLFCYETVFLVAIVIPLLERQWDPEFRRRFLRHIGIVLAILAGAVLIRSAAGEVRVSEMTPIEMLKVSVEHMVVSPAFAGTSYIWRAWNTLAGVPGVTLWSLVLSALGLFAWLSWLPLPTSYVALRKEDSAHGRKRTDSMEKAAIDNRSLLREMRWWAVTAILMMVLAYPFTLTTGAYARYGRGTRGHAAAIFGAALLAAALLTLLHHYAARYRASVPATLFLSVLFGSLLAWGVSIQYQYAVSWSAQKSFWRGIITQSPDLEDGDSLLVPPNGLYASREMPVWHWAMPLMFEQIYKMPAEWKVRPAVFRMRWDWREKLQESGIFWSVCDPPPKDGARRAENIILFTGSATDLKREPNPFTIEGRRFTVKDNPSSDESPLEKGPLYKYLVGQ